MSGIRNLPEDLIFNESFQDYVIGNDPLSARKWNQWLKNNPEHREDFQRAKEILVSIKFKGYEIPEDQFEFDLTRLRKAIQPEVSAKPSPKRSVGSSLQTFFGRIAATLLILAATSGIFYYFIYSGQIKDDHTVLSESIVKTSPPGTKTTIALKDGTKVKLNSGSTLEYPEEFGDERILRLKGEAFFEVARDSLRPFIIYSNELEIRVLGTSFNVKAYDDEEEVEVAVATGLVAVKEQNSPRESGIFLNPREKAVYHKGKNTIETHGFDEDLVFGWRSGILVFENAEFKEIVQELERWYGIEITVADDLKIQKGYTGKFENETLKRVLEGLSFSLDFGYRIRNSKVEIFK